MLNLIKADVYRILRGKGFYIALAFLITMYVLQALGEFGSIGVNVSNTEQGKEALEVLQPNTEALLGMNAPMYLLRTADNYLYFLLVFIVIIASADFSDGSTKNVLSCGVSRLQYYTSKLIMSWGVAILLVVTSVVVPTLLITVKNGFGNPVDSLWLEHSLKAYSLLILFFMAMTGIGIFFVFATRKTAAVYGLYIAFCMAPLTIIGILSMISDRYIKFFKYEFILNIRNLADIQIFTSADYQRVIMIGMVYLVVSVLAGYQLFRRCDIK